MPGLECFLYLVRIYDITALRPDSAPEFPDLVRKYDIQPFHWANDSFLLARATIVNLGHQTKDLEKECFPEAIFWLSWTWQRALTGIGPPANAPC